MRLEKYERTRDIYEDNPAYPRPPQIPLTELSLDNVCRALHMKKTVLSRCALWILSKPTGFARFYKDLPAHLDGLLKTSDLRRSCLQAPVISATLTLEDDSRVNDPLDRAVTLLLGAKSFYDALQNGRLVPDRLREMPLEMGQYPNLFSTSLTVENRKSRIFKSTKVDQITILVKGQIYLFQIKSWDGNTAFHEIKSTLKAIVDHSAKSEELQVPVGMVTYASQMVQVRGFTRMQQVQGNQDNINKLKHSFVTLCLDLDKNPENDSDAFINSHANNPENRWSWQSLQFVVHGNSKACVICNFSAYLDGNTMMRGAAEICRRAASVELPVHQGKIGAGAFEHLNWQVNLQLLDAARSDYEKIKDNQQATFFLQNVSRKKILKYDVDPVALFVIALNMTMKPYVAKPPVVHQFLTMSKYRYMDLTTAIVSTPEVLRFCNWMHNKDDDVRQGLDLLKNAINSQKQVCRKERSAFSLTTIYSLFLMSLRGLQKFNAVLIFMIADFFLRKTKHMQATRRDIVISHPAIYPQVSMVGRPGIRLPYVTYFALHYQLWDDKTVITMMPGMRWQVKNEQFIAELEANMCFILDVAGSGMK